MEINYLYLILYNPHVFLLSLHYYNVQYTKFIVYCVDILGYRVDETVNFGVSAKMVKKYKSNTQRYNITSQCPKFLLCLQYLSSNLKLLKNIIFWLYELR